VSIDDARIAAALGELVAEEPDFGLAAADVLHHARRRRRIRRRRRAVSGAVVLAAGTALTLSLAGPFGHADDREPGGHAPTGPAAEEPGAFRCGDPLPGTPARTLDGFTLRATGVRDPRDGGPPTLDFTILAPAPADLDASALRPTVLVLVDGRIVGGPLPPEMAESLVGSVAPRWPAREGPITDELRAPDRLCGTTTWPQLLAAPESVELGLVMSPPAPAWTDKSQPPPTTPTRLFNPDTDPYLAATTPLPRPN